MSSPPAPRRSTIVDVANAVGVSRQTVTRALNDLPGISVGTRGRVLTAARDLNYRPSRFGRGMQGKQPPTLGLLVNEFANPFYGELADRVLARARELGWTVQIAGLTGDPRDEAATLRALAVQVDAIVGYVSVPEPLLSAILGPTPLVALDAHANDRAHGTVVFDVAAAIAEAAALLAGAGRSRVVVLDIGAAPTPRAEAFLGALRALGIEARVARVVEQGVDVAADVIRALFDDDSPPDALIAFNDIGALRALDQLLESGVAVPAECAIVGFDGIAIGEFARPRLTTVSVDIAACARDAVDLAVGIFGGSIDPAGAAGRRAVSGRLVVRDSA